MKEPLYLNSLEHLRDEQRRMARLLYISSKTVVREGSDDFQRLFVAEGEVKNLLEPSDGIEEGALWEIEKLKSEYLKFTEEIAEKRNNSIRKNIFLSLVSLQNIFRLSPFETDVLLLSLLPDIHKKYERVFGYLNDDITLKRPTVRLVSEMLSTIEDSKLWMLSYFLKDNNLFRYDILRLADATDNAGVSSRMLKTDERIINYLLEAVGLDSIISSFCGIKMPATEVSEIRLSPDIKENFISMLRNHMETGSHGKKLFINMSGPSEHCKKKAAEAFCGEVNIPLITVDIEDIVGAENSFSTIVKRVFREGILQPAAVYFENIDILSSEEEKYRQLKKQFIKMASELSWITFLSGDYNSLSRQDVLSRNIFINIDFPVPDGSGRKKIWHDVLTKENIQIAEEDLSSLANNFMFTEDQILGAVSISKNVAWSTKDSCLSRESLYEGCRLQSNHKLTTLAQRLKSNHNWNDIVLPEDRLAQLKEISEHIKYKDVVYGDWGFNKKLNIGRGLNILFSGPSGTGKTMAAGVIANDLGLELYKIDLSTIVSKYIGETEKNLSKLFAEAERSNAILFFDEADALFGKRSEVKDAHDRYANIEINYLLQKMEEHEGVVIMATNLSNNIDSAFIRRMQFVVEFPFPDEKEREIIWRRVFPERTPLANDIDYKFLHERLKVAGGNIKNIALKAAFYAARNSTSIGMGHILSAAKVEYQKMGKSFLKSDFEPYFGLIDRQSGSKLYGQTR